MRSIAAADCVMKSDNHKLLTKKQLRSTMVECGMHCLHCGQFLARPIVYMRVMVITQNYRRLPMATESILLLICYYSYMAHQSMCCCPYSYHHQHCQHRFFENRLELTKGPSYSQSISYLPASQETDFRQRPTLKASEQVITVAD